jgi:hypothetical protein
MHLRLAADLLFRSWFALASALVVASLVHDSDFFRLLDVQPSDRVANSEFGVYGCDGFTRTTEVDLVPGETFGWRLEVPDGRPVMWREELVLPSAPMQWSGANFVDIKDGGRTAVTAGIDMPYDGVMAHAWNITDGDPPGEYELRLWVDGQLHEIFRFQVN